MELLLWYEEGPIGVFVRESLWGYPITLSCHAVGMATVMGIVIVLNMRVLGFAKGLSIAAFDKLFIIGWIGFIINLISGLVLFAGTTTTYFFQGAFQLISELGSWLVRLNRARRHPDESRDERRAFQQTPGHPDRSRARMHRMLDDGPRHGPPDGLPGVRDKR